MIQPISKLKPKEYVSKQFIVDRFEVRTNSIGKQFIFALLKDDSGVVRAVYFDQFEPSKVENIDKDVVLLVEGKVEMNNGDISIKMSNFEPVFDKTKINYSHFMDSFDNLNETMEKILKTIDTVKDKDYNRLLKQIFSDKFLVASFKIFPAAKSWHHAKIGGLAYHTLEIINTCEFLVKQYPQLDRDLLISSAILHDIGKLQEFDVGVTREYSQSGKLIGHISLGAQLVASTIDKLEKFDKTKKDLIIHSILSHHGKYEFQSPVLPKTLEAFALNLADDMSAKFNAMMQVKEKERIDLGWSQYNKLLDRPLFYHNENVDDAIF